jgi:hypothetical protein
MFSQQQNIYISNVGTAAKDFMDNVCTPAQLLHVLTKNNNSEVANLHTAAQYIKS